MSFDRQLFIWLSLSFIVATVIGTLTHEGGHYLVAKYFGYDAHINYEGTCWTDTTNSEFINSVYSKYQKEISSGKDFPGKERLHKIWLTRKKNQFWIGLAGPLETMLTGTIGLGLLFFNRKRFENQIQLSIFQWSLIFISLFWLRQTANLIVWAGRYFLTGKFFQGGDEMFVASHLHIPGWSLITITAIIGAIILAIVIFKFVPARQRITFIASGLVGGISGYILWLVLFGKYILP